jgi:hypothetical protein
MTAAQTVALILALIGLVCFLAAAFITTADARIGWIGGALTSLGVIFLALEDKIAD